MPEPTGPPGNKPQTSERKIRPRAGTADIISGALKVSRLQLASESIEMNSVFVSFSNSDRLAISSNHVHVSSVISDLMNSAGQDFCEASDVSGW